MQHPSNLISHTRLPYPLLHIFIEYKARSINVFASAAAVLNSRLKEEAALGSGLMESALFRCDAVLLQYVCVSARFIYFPLFAKNVKIIRNALLLGICIRIYYYDGHFEIQIVSLRTFDAPTSALTGDAKFKLTPRSLLNYF